MSAPMEAPNLDGFEILTRLSSGGMGEVLLARRRGAHGFEKLVAIKTIKVELTKRPEIQAMFLDEARLSARLDHPNIAHVHDFGEASGVLFLAMEYVPGLALNKVVQKLQGPIPPSVAMRIMAEVCRGLHAAHELRDADGTPLGVVHRDVTPGNLILTFEGHVKILDFGIAFMRGRESPDTMTGELKGKPSYMAPEHLRGEPVDRRADVYSASVVLYEILTGRKLFTRDTVFATMHAVETFDPPPPSSLVGPLPPRLDEVVLRGLSKRASERFEDAKALARELDLIIAETPLDTLESFVERALSRERIEHAAWLRRIVTGQEPTPLRASRVATRSDEPATRSDEPATRSDEPATRSDEPATRSDEPATHASSDAPKTRSDAPSTHAQSDAPKTRSAEHPPRKQGPLSAHEPRPGTEPLASKRRKGVGIAASVALVGLLAGFGLRAGLPSGVGPNALAPPRIADPSVPDPTTATGPSARAPTKAAEPVEGSSAGGHRAEPSAGLEEQEKSLEHTGPETADRRSDPVKPRGERESGSGARQGPRLAKEPSASARLPRADARDRPPADSQVATRYGFVTIGAEPYALVRIDGQEAGVTPVMKKKLEVGTHEILLLRPDTGEVRSKRTIVLGENEQLSVRPED